MTQKYSDEAKALMGANVARILQLRRDREHRDRFQTTWGSKTALGIFHTVMRIAEEINAGPNSMCDDLRYENGRRDA